MREKTGDGSRGLMMKIHHYKEFMFSDYPKTVHNHLFQETMDSDATQPSWKLAEKLEISQSSANIYLHA